ncbi:hypothetical protein Droror1_Dr00026508 [Drosera rotundifolia]
MPKVQWRHGMLKKSVHLVSIWLANSSETREEDTGCLGESRLSCLDLNDCHAERLSWGFDLVRGALELVVKRLVQAEFLELIPDALFVVYRVRWVV